MAKKKTIVISPDDPVTAFALDVVNGKIIAGSHVVNQCKRHILDLKHGADRGLTFDVERAAHAIGFFEDVLRLNGGQYEGAPFKLLRWQAFVVGSLFGWINEDESRRFRVAYVETAKGSGKSPLAAGIGMFGLTADNEARAEIYSAAAKKDQAQILFRDAVAMVDHSPQLRKRLHKSGIGERCWNIAYLKEGSFFRPISSDDAQSGSRPHIALIDEIHEHKTNNVVEMMRAGTKSRSQALIFMITNAGASKTSVCWEYHEVACLVASGEQIDDSLFTFVCSIDAVTEEEEKRGKKGDDPFADERCWYKANPSLEEADLPGLKYIREQVTAARNMPSKEAIVRRLNFCQWTDAVAPWLSHELWNAARRDYDIDSLRGRNAIAALDLSSTTDLTGIVVIVEPIEEGEPWKMLAFPYLPDTDLDEKSKADRVPYVQWKAEGLLNTTPGRAISKRIVLQKLSQLSEIFGMLFVGYDRWRIEDLLMLASDDGITLPEMKPFGQGYKDMSPAIEKFEAMLLNGELVHNGHKIMTWCAGNAVTHSDEAGNRKLDKSAATGRIDLIVAAVMAAGLINSTSNEKSFWEQAA